MIKNDGPCSYEEQASYKEENKELRERLKDMSRLVSDWVWEIDANLKFTHVSDRVFDIVQMHPIELIGDSIEYLLYLTEKNENLPNFNWHSPFRNLKLRMRTKSGNDRIVLISGLPKYNASGKFDGVRGTIRDVTNEERTLQELVVALNDAKIANKSKSEFLANMSHELRTPLNAIVGFSETLKHEIFGPLANTKQQEYVDGIHKSGKRLLGLIIEILDISAIETGKLALKKKEVNVYLAIDKALRLIKDRAKDQGVQIQAPENDAVDDLSLTTFGDELRITQILVNLLSNAVKFTKQGGSVRIAAYYNEEGSVTISITDTGIGMSENEIATALEKFGQVLPKGGALNEGTGLGLPITKSLVEANGGRMEVTSILGEGTTVTVILPSVGEANLIE